MTVLLSALWLPGAGNGASRYNDTSPEQQTAVLLIELNIRVPDSDKK